MLRRNSRLLLALLAVSITVVSITGITFSQRTSPADNGNAAQIQSLHLPEQEEPGLSSLKPGEVKKAGIMFQNSGENPCRLRVKLCIPTFEDREVLQPGTLEQGVFRGLGSTSEKNGEYWTCEGEYIYYKNGKTGDLLPPGKKTVPLYTAVRFNPEIRAELLPKGMTYELHAVLQTAPETGAEEPAAWKTQELKN